MMFMHYLLVVLVVLLGNIQTIATEDERLSEHSETLSNVLENNTNQVKPATEDNKESIHKEETQGNPHGGLTSAPTMKVTDLHDPLNILDRINKTDTTHSHSITPEDFAQVTSVINTTLKDKSPSIPTLPNLEVEETLSSLIIPVQDVPVDGYKLLLDGPISTDSTTTEKYDAHEIQSRPNTLNITEVNSVIDGVINVTSSSDSLTNEMIFSCAEDNCDSDKHDPYKSLNFTELENKVRDDIKTYSNEAVIRWEDLKEQISSDSEVSHVLNDYHDKIKISQAVNRSECVQVHVDKYENRLRFLKDVMQSCEANLKREQWQELQSKTKEMLNAINEIAREVNLAKDSLQKHPGENYATIESIESEGRSKLESLNVESEKQALSDLQKAALNADEDDYRDCITHNIGQEIIVDTLNDIMTIKNNCVG